MKNKIILAIFIILSIMNSCKNNVTGGGGGGGKKVTIKDNFETPQTNSKEAKDYLINYQQYSAKYSKAELMSYTIHSNFIDTGYYSKYYFDENANLTNILNKQVNYKFWGMLPEDKQIALYYRETNGRFELYDRALRYEKGIKSKSFYSDDNLMKNMLLAVFDANTNINPDTSKINPIQTNTKNANDWKKQVTNKTISRSYVFDSYGNLAWGSDSKYTFWGATNDGANLYGLYYISNWSPYRSFYYSSPRSFYIEVKTNIFPYGSNPYRLTYITNISTNVWQGDFREAEKIIFPIKTNYTYIYTNLKTSTTTAENETYKNNVRNKIIEEKDVMNTYTFLPNGDIEAEAYNGKTYTLHFWGAKDSTNGIYYVKINLKDIFGNVAPNLETYFYYGYRFDETTYKNRPILREYWQNHPYYDSFNDWHSNNFDKNGNPKNNIDWNSMPLQTTNINWTTSGGGLQDDIYLREK